MWSQRQSDKTKEKNASELRRQLENLWIEKILDLRKIELYMKSLAGRKTILEIIMVTAEGRHRN